MKTTHSLRPALPLFPHSSQEKWTGTELLACLVEEIISLRLGENEIKK
jgi:hypothetical protein